MSLTTVNFHVQVNATSCQSKFEVHRVMTDALAAIETVASGTMKVYGLPSGHIIPAVQALALGQSINLHSALS